MTPEDIKNEIIRNGHLAFSRGLEEAANMCEKRALSEPFNAAAALREDDGED